MPQRARSVFEAVPARLSGLPPNVFLGQPVGNRTRFSTAHTLSDAGATDARLWVSRGEESVEGSRVIPLPLPPPADNTIARFHVILKEIA